MRLGNRRFYGIILQDERTPHPVAVYLHGGAFNHRSGAGLGDQNLIDLFVTKGIVFVTVNYRLGVMGT